MQYDTKVTFYTSAKMQFNVFQNPHFFHATPIIQVNGFIRFIYNSITIFTAPFISFGHKQC